MSIYNLDIAAETSLKLTERSIYGSSRVGLEAPGYIVASTSSANVDELKTEQLIGDRRYELSNHLGNVLEVITDRKLQEETIERSGILAYYSPDVVSQSDYYPFGMLLPGRNDQGTNDYRYGFQGQEDDPEVKGEGNSVNYKYRMHDPWIGRFFAVDLLAPKYPELTPYQFSSNRPIDYIELEGLEGLPSKSYGTMFIYYMGGDNWDAFGLLGHTGIGYYGPDDVNPTPLYNPAGGDKSHVQMRRFNGSGYSGLLRGTSEAQTIKNYYLDEFDELVQRVHYPVEGGGTLVSVLESDIYQGTLDGWWCTGTAWYAIYETAILDGFSTEEAEAKADKIIFFSRPKEMSQSQVEATGSKKYDEFYKEGESYVHDRYQLIDGTWKKQTSYISTELFIEYMTTEEAPIVPNKKDEVEWPVFVPNYEVITVPKW